MEDGRLVEVNGIKESKADLVQILGEADKISEKFH